MSQIKLTDISADKSSQIIASGIQKAKELRVSVNIAIVDIGANLNAFVRMDGAWLGSIDIAIKKARTARLFDRDSADIGKISQPGGPVYGIEHTNGGLVTFGGGVPLRNCDGAIVGAVAVSGSTVGNDQAIAEAAAHAMNTSKSAS